MTTLIPENDIWTIWAIVIGIAALAFFLEQRFKWGAKISSVLLALIGSLVLVNLRVLPTGSPVYDALGGYILPLAIPLLLFQSDLRKIIKESGRLLIIFIAAGATSVLGGIICGFLFRSALAEQTAGYVAVEVGADIGGSVNLVAMASAFNVDESIMNASLIIGNLIIIIWTAAIIAIPNMPFFRKHYRHEHIDALEANIQLDDGETMASKFWKRQGISLLDIAKCLAITFAVNAVTQQICNAVNASGAPEIIKTFFGSIYLVMTTLTIVLVTAMPKVFENIHGATELGTIMITMWFVQVGAGARISEIISLAPAVLGFKILMAVINIGGVLLLGKFLKWNVEECLTASNASLGGPTTAAAYVIGKGWAGLIAPATLVGLFGYVIGNYFAVLTANIFL
ncbi:MAG: DUF819 domain-containing protein [Dorea sp.]|jgi:uncharacterized membrane protein|nr:DUF819 domain-containing protein [Dorea sp.]MCI9249973.1 DUF819 domain-containing protein [Dorea sp.]